MKKKRIVQYCCAALVAAGVGLNIQNAIADYGIAENSLSLVAVGPGSNSGSNSNSNSNSNYHEYEETVEVVKMVHKGWKKYKTDTQKDHIKDNKKHQDDWYDYKEATWNECETVSYLQYIFSFKQFCSHPKSKAAAGITATGSVKPGGEWYCPQDDI